MNHGPSFQAGPAGPFSLGLMVNAAGLSPVCLWPLLLEEKLREPGRVHGAEEKDQGGSDIF